MIGTTSTLVEIERYFAADAVNAFEVLEAAAVEPLTIDPFNIGRSVYETRAAAEAIFSYIEQREIEATDEQLAVSLDELRQTADAVRRGEVLPVCVQQVDPDRHELAMDCLRGAISAALSANPLNGEALAALSSSAAGSGLLTISQLRPSYLWLESRFNCTLEEFLQMAYVPARQAFSKTPEADLYDPQFVRERVTAVIQELQAAGGNRGR